MPEICLERTANFEINSQDTHYNSVTGDQSFYQVSCHPNADGSMTEQFCNSCSFSFKTDFLLRTTWKSIQQLKFDHQFQ